MQGGRWLFRQGDSGSFCVVILDFGSLFLACLFYAGYIFVDRAFVVGFDFLGAAGFWQRAEQRQGRGNFQEHQRFDILLQRIVQ